MLNQLMHLIYQDQTHKGYDASFAITTLRELYHNLIHASALLDDNDKVRLSKIQSYISLLCLSETVVENKEDVINQKATIIEIPNISMLILSIPFVFENYPTTTLNALELSSQIEKLARKRNPTRSDLHTLLKYTIEQILQFFSENEDLRFKLLTILSAKQISDQSQLKVLLNKKITYSIEEIAQKWHTSTSNISQWVARLYGQKMREDDKLNACEFIALYQLSFPKR